MVAPGKNLDFNFSPRFLARLDHADPLAIAVRDAIENRPTGGSIVVGDIRELSVDFEGGTYVVLFRHKGNTVGLMSIHEWPREAAMLSERKAEYKKLFFKGMKP